MTYNEYNQRVWRAACMPEKYISAALELNDRMNPGHGERKAVKTPGLTWEQMIVRDVKMLKDFRRLPTRVRKSILATMDAEIERENRRN